MIGDLSLSRCAALAALVGVAVVGCTQLAGLDADFEPRPGAGGSTTSGVTSGSAGGAGGGGQGGSSSSGGGQDGCHDDKKDGDETSTDCGGSCTPCASGKACDGSADCISGDCEAGTCRSITSVAAGQLHTCALTESKRVKCWGDNTHGQLGSGTHDSPTPLDVDLPNVTMLTAGSNHNCAKPETGNILCWGWNNHDQLGVNVGMTPFSNTPIASQSAGILFMASAGTSYVCVASTVISGARCWGGDAKGQLGDGGTTDSATPKAVTAVSGSVSGLASGDSHACAIVDGKAICWGKAIDGQLGDGTATDLAEVAAGQLHTCARTTDGHVVCWGSNTHEQLGIVSPTGSASPQPVVGVTATALSAGSNHTCAVDAGKVLCWGDNTFSQLGQDAATLPMSASPVAIKDLEGVIQVSAGARHSCAVTGGGAVYCWGTNDNGELGVGPSEPKTTPVAVSFP